MFIKKYCVKAKDFLLGIKHIKRYLAAAGGCLFVLLFVFFGPPNLYNKTSKPDFCNSCHVMNPQYEAWFMTGLHRNAACVDCHLPNTGGIRHFVWKGITGMRDLIMFHTGVYSAKIEISSHGKKVIQENCLRCHESMVSVMSTDGRNCWSCHRRVNHNFPMISAR